MKYKLEGFERGNVQDPQYSRRCAVSTVYGLKQDLYNMHKDDFFRGFTVNEIDIYPPGLSAPLSEDSVVPELADDSRFSVKCMLFEARCYHV